jgi:tetratricopeptide (TPR) repeat protein
MRMANRSRKKAADVSRQRQSAAKLWLGHDSPLVTLAVYLGLLTAVAIVYAQTLRFEFVNFDDKSYVYQNPQVRKGVTWEGFAWAFGDFHQYNWHPLTWLSHMADCQMYPLWPGGHHLTAILLHAATALVLFFVLHRMTGRRWPSASLAALFAIHPLHVESVAWVAERKDVLSGVFFVLTLAAYAGYVRRPFSIARYLLVTLCFALGLLAKPMLVTLPFVLMLLDYWPLKRWAFASSASIILEKVPLILMAAVSCAVTWFAQQGSIKPLDHFPLVDRFANALVSYAGYLLQFFWPTGLAAQYPYVKDQPIWAVAASIGLLAAISVAAAASRSRYPYFFVGWLWYLGMLVPVIGLVQVGDQAHADRYMYLPLIGPAMALAWAIADFARTSARRWLCAIASAAVLAALTVASWRQVDYWRDSEALWTRALSCTHDNWLALNNLGMLRMKTGHLDDAIADFEAALEIGPNLTLTHNSLGLALAERGDSNAAFVHFQKALDIDPNDAETHNNFALALSRFGQLEPAIQHYEEALRIRPDYAEAHNNLALMLQGAGRVDAAIEHYRKALDIWPDDAEACNNLATALYYAGNQDAAKLDEAITYLQRAVALKPDFTQARQNLAAVKQSRAALRRGM